MALNVNKGDVVNLSVWAKAVSSGGSTTVVNATTFANALVSALTTQNLAVGEVSSTITAGVNTGVSALGAGGHSNAAATGYLNYMVYDEAFHFVTAGFTSTTATSYSTLSLSTISIGQNGYLIAWVSYESSSSGRVFFDDFTVQLVEGTVLQQDNYYPFGMTTVASWKENAYEDPGFKYQGDFADYDEQTRTYDFLLRSYDPAIGRFTAVDPAGQFASPYVGMGNTPHIGTDANGAVFSGGGLIIDLGVSLIANLFLQTAQAGTETLNGNGTFRDNFNAQGISAGFDYNTGSGWQYTGKQQESIYIGGYEFHEPEQIGYWETGPYIDEVDNAGGIVSKYKFTLETVGYRGFQSSGGGPWIGPHQDHYYTVSDAGHLSAIGGIMSNMVGSAELGAGKFIAERSEKLLNGTAKLHPSFMNLADDTPELANGLLSGSNTVKLAKGARVLGRVATGASILVSGAKIVSGTAWDYLDIGVNAFATYGVPVLVGASMMSNPVGWAIGGAALVYNGYRIYQEW